MTKTELAEKLNHLDPGATLTVEQGILASLFGAGVPPAIGETPDCMLRGQYRG
jgi:hypothetical protein